MLERKLPLNEEEKIHLEPLMESDTFRTLLKVLEHLAGYQSKEVMSIQSEEEKKLSLAKARYEGADKLIKAFKQTFEKKTRH